MTRYRPSILQSVKGPHVLNLAYPFKDGLHDVDGAAPTSRAADGPYEVGSWPYSALGADESRGIALTSGSPWVQPPPVTASYLSGRFRMFWWEGYVPANSLGLASFEDITARGFNFLSMDESGRIPTQWDGGPLRTASHFGAYTWQPDGSPTLFTSSGQVSYFQFGSESLDAAGVYAIGPTTRPDGCDVEYEGNGYGTNLSPVSVTVEWEANSDAYNYAGIVPLAEPDLAYLVELPSLPYMRNTSEADAHHPQSSALFRSGIVRAQALGGELAGGHVGQDTGWVTSTFSTDHWPITLAVVGSEIYTGQNQQIGEVTNDTTIYQTATVKKITCTIEVLPSRYRFVERVGVGGLG